MATVIGIFAMMIGLAAFVAAVYLWSNKEKNYAAEATILMNEMKADLKSLKAEQENLTARVDEAFDSYDSLFQSQANQVLDVRDEVSDLKSDLKNKSEANTLEFKSLHQKMAQRPLGHQHLSPTVVQLKVDRPVPIQVIPRTVENKKPKVTKSVRRQ